MNTTNPGSGAPWDEVASVTNSSGTHSTSGSAIHVGGGYMLTANHVSLAQGYVSFDGSSTYQIASGSSVQVMSGTDVVDLKVFQITNNPGTSGVNLFRSLRRAKRLTSAQRLISAGAPGTILPIHLILGLGGILPPVKSAGASMYLREPPSLLTRTGGLIITLNRSILRPIRMPPSMKQPPHSMILVQACLSRMAWTNGFLRARL